MLRSDVFVGVNAEVDEHVDDTLVFIVIVSVILESRQKLEVLLQQLHPVFRHVGVVRANRVAHLFLR